MRPVLWVCIAGCSVLSLCCDLFTTRDPEPPSQNTSSFVQPVTADIVVENFKNAFRDYNPDNYVRCFSDTMNGSREYSFIPSVEISAQYPGIFNEWTTEDERYYFQNMGQPSNGNPYITFSAIQSLAVSSDSVVYSMDYTLFYPHRRNGITQIVQGNMQLFIGANPQRVWSIYKWQDNRTISDSTWSYWKAVFSGS